MSKALDSGAGAILSDSPGEGASERTPTRCTTTIYMQDYDETKNENHVTFN